MTGDYDVSLARYRLKKVARHAAVTLGRAFRAISPADSRCIRVLTYHRFEGSRLDPCSIDLSMFLHQLRWLTQQCHVMTPASFAAAMNTSDAPERGVLITIDDGHASVFKYALPALASFGIRAVIFVCPGLIEAESAGKGESNRAFMGWEQLADARAAGHEIAPHGLTHRSLARMPLSEAAQEIEQCTALLQRRLGVKTLYFSLPFGTRLDYSEALLGVLRSYGYRYCFTSMHGYCRPRYGTGLLSRLKIEGTAGLGLFPHIVSGCLDHWSIVDRYFFAFQQRGRL